MVVLAIIRMNHLTKVGNIVANSNSTMNNNNSSTDDHTASSVIHTEKMFLSNGNLGQEPTTPCVLNTPNTCTKNTSFFYDIPANMQANSVSGKVIVSIRYFLFSMISIRVLTCKIEKEKKMKSSPTID
jgi:hypothetical protein